MGKLIFISGPCDTMWDLQRARKYAEELEAEGFLVYMPQLTAFRCDTLEQARRIDLAWLEKADAVLEIGGDGFCYQTWGIAPFRLFYPVEINALFVWAARSANKHDGYQPVRARLIPRTADEWAARCTDPNKMHGASDEFGGSDVREGRVRVYARASDEFGGSD